jgi:SAM-dependent methyltransferase
MQSSSPQAQEMAHESMVRNLAAQAEAIWPQEAPIFERHPAPSHILDVGCGTGEITSRLAELFPKASLVGLDLEQAHLDRARSRLEALRGRVRFERGDALSLPFAEASFDLVVCRHLLQALPDAARAIHEMVRVARPGGRLHVLAEDYGMLWCHPTPRDADQFWQQIPPKYGAAIGCDLHVGREMFTLMKDAGLTQIRVDYAVVDTLRVPRDTFARIWEAWRDGYTDTLAQHSGVSRGEVERWWNEMIAAARDERGYALWQVPIWTAQKP